MTIAAIKEYLILFLIGFVVGNSVKVKESLLLNEWDLLIGPINKNHFYGCNGIFIDPQVFITDAECIQNALQETFNGKIFINEIRGGNPIIEANEINKNDIYYNEDLSKSYNNSKLSIAIIILTHTIIPKYHNKEVKFISLPNSSDDVDFSKCFVSQPNRLIMNLNFCNLVNCLNDGKNDYCKNFRCALDVQDVISGNTVICSLKEEPEVYVLSGLLSENGNMSTVGDRVVFLEFENLSDLRNVIDKKLALINLKKKKNNVIKSLSQTK